MTGITGISSPKGSVYGEKTKQTPKPAPVGGITGISSPTGK